MTWKLNVAWLLIVVVLMTPESMGYAQSNSLPVVRIATVVDGPWAQNTDLLSTFRSEILALTEREFDVRFDESKHRVADFTIDGVKTALDQLLNDRTVDVVLALGPLSSHEVSSRGSLPKPVVAAFVIDPVIQGLPMSNGTSGVKNLSYLTIPETMKRDLEMFLEITPFNKLTILANQYMIDSIPGISDKVSAQVESADVEATFVGVGDSVDEVLAALPPDTEAVYLFPLIQLGNDEVLRLVNALNDRRLPTFSYLGQEEVEIGVLAGLNPDLFPRLTRRVALNVQRILLGSEPGDVPTAFTSGERLFINIATAEKIGKYPSWAIITEAELIGQSTDKSERFYTLTSVMQGALAANLDLIAAGHFVEAGAHKVNVARSPILPQVAINATGSIINKDRAEVGIFGPERTLAGGATLSQVILDEDTFAGYSIQGHLQDGRREQWHELRLDVMQQAANVYFDVLRSTTQERIKLNDLQLSRTNLELARVRLSIGQSTPADVYRWESAIASNRKEAITLNASRNVAEIELNRVIYRPLEESFELDEVLVDNAKDLIPDYPYLVYFGNKVSFREFRSFLVEEGILASPEIKQIDAAIAAEGRALSKAGHDFWIPKVGVFGSYSHLFSTGGVGADEFEALGFDKDSWEVGAQLSYPIFNGLGRVSEKKRSREALSDLEVQRVSAVQRIEQRIRSSLHTAGGSFAGIQQAKIASTAASNNLNLVTDSYSRGTVSIIELLDAQNAFIVADEAAANSVYDFLIDLLAVQRSIGRFDYLMSEEEKAVFNERMGAFMSERGITTP